MPTTKRGKIIVIVSCSGTGKTTLIKKLRSEIQELEWSVSSTTRPQRDGEIDGEDYFFISKEEFEKQLKEDQFIEWAIVHSNYYGTTKKFVSDGLIEGKFLLFDIDIQGADAIKKSFPNDAEVIFIVPPSIDELKKRLINRRTDSMEVIEERLNNAKRELKKQNDYDHIILNDKLDQAYNDLKNVVLQVLGS